MLASAYEDAALLTQTGGGELHETAQLPLSAKLWSRNDGGAVAGDLDGDGRTDAAIASGPSIDIFLQRGGRSLPPRR